MIIPYNTSLSSHHSITFQKSFCSLRSFGDVSHGVIQLLSCFLLIVIGACQKNVLLFINVGDIDVNDTNVLFDDLNLVEKERKFLFWKWCAWIGGRRYGIEYRNKQLCLYWFCKGRCWKKERYVGKKFAVVLFVIYFVYFEDIVLCLWNSISEYVTLDSINFEIRFLIQ